MSIYSGLPTRQDQRNYNNLLVRLIQTLQDHIFDVTKGIIETKFANKYQKIVGKMETYQQHKYLPPKFSTLLAPLIKTIYNSRAQVFQQVNQKTVDKNAAHLILESVKEEDEMPSARETMMKKKLTKSNVKKNHSDSGHDDEQKKRWLHKNDHYHTRYSAQNRRSCSVFSTSKKKPILNQIKEGERTQMSIITENKYNTQTKKSQQFFHNRKTPLAMIQQKKRKIFLKNSELEEQKANDGNQSHSTSKKKYLKTQLSKGSIPNSLQRRLLTNE